MKNVKSLWIFFALALTMSVASSRAQAAPFDQQFIDSMTPHHQSALVMAQMAITKAQLPEVRKLARGIIRDQKKEIAQMQAWRKAWYPNAAMPMMSGMDHGSMGGMKMSGDKMKMSGEMMGLPMKGEMDMSKLRRARGRDFDRMFLQMMIPHHAGAVTMSKEALQKAEHQEIKILATQIITAQEAEIKMMRDWQTKWTK